MNDTNTGKKRGLFWWPTYLLILSIIMAALVAVMIVISIKFPVPYLAPDQVPMPDEGENIPGPEWIFLLFWQGFWYFGGSLKKYLVLMPVIPILTLVFFVFLPVMHKLPIDRIPGLKNLIEKARGLKGLARSFTFALPALIFAFVILIGVYKSGHQAKVLGCDSCHNASMGPRMAIPPVNVAKYYATERALQIGVGKYRAGKLSAESDTSGEASRDEGQGYKDANWQMRHMYEPTFTW